MEIAFDQEYLRTTKLFFATPCYGGVCNGIYARCLVDLVNIATQIGFPVQIYMLFNESLITRARNYAVDEFMRSDATHFFFVDADVGFNPMDVITLMLLQRHNTENDYDIIGAAYPKKSLPYNTIVTTEDGPQKLGMLVKNKYNGKVLSINELNGKMEWNKVLTHSDDPGHNTKKWVSINGSPKKSLVCTDDHELIVFDNVLEPSNIHRVAAKDSLGKYIFKLSESTPGKIENPLYNSEQISFLIGTLFGDGSVTKTGYLKFGHSDLQYDYLNLKQKLFGGLVSKERVTGEYKEKEYHAKWLDCPRNEQILKLRELFYVDEKKTIKNVINLLDEKGLSFWYMDDGSYGLNTMFCSESFSYDDHLLIQQWFKNKFDIGVNIQTHGSGYRLYVLKSSENTFFKLISKYIPLYMEYKLPEEYRSGVKHHFNFIPLEFSAELIKKVKIVDNKNPNSHHQPLRQYDIGVENNHNFIANGFTVSNCISWEKIKMAVDKGFAEPSPEFPDRNPENLASFVGDYVFNPKTGNNILISEPCEVLELGTGFMMVKRSAFETFRDAHPEFLYRPDHVRTEHFDGSRQITQYFQAEIDQIDFRTFYENAILKLTLFEDENKVIPAKEVYALIEAAKVENSKKSNRYLSEDYWFCCPQKTTIETLSDGQKSIKWIVDNKYTGKVKSINSAGEVEWKSVTNHIIRRNGKRGLPETKKKWVKLNTTKDNNTKSKLIVTEEHRVAYFEDIFNPYINYTEAKNMEGKYCIRNPQRTENVLYSKDQLQFLYGTLLGDGCIHKNGQLLITHCNEQEDYINLKATLFNGVINTGLQSERGFKEGTCLNLHSPVNAQLHKLHELIYINGSKTVKNILPLLDKKSLATWYMDDGSLNNDANVRISTEGFSYEDHLLIQEWFKERWNIEVVISEKSLVYKGKNNDYFYVRMNNESSRKFFNLIEEYIIPSMKYKLPEDWVVMKSFDYTSIKSLDFSASLIKEVKYLPNYSSNLYDIEVEDNHNFFANGSLVHNCQKTQELGLKTWLCPWMKLNHTGTMTYGGSLSDIAALGASPTADINQLKKNKGK